MVKDWNRIRPLLTGLLLAAAFFGLYLGRHLLPDSNMFPKLFASAPTPAEDILVEPKTLSFQVESTGILRATSVRDFGAPPMFLNYWQFQIASMIPEGRNVKAGDVLLSFNAQKIADDLQRFKNELDQATKELEKTRAQVDLEREEIMVRLAAAENKREKVDLKLQGMSKDLAAASELEQDRLSLEQAKMEVEALKDRLERQQKRSEARYRIIESKRARAENKVSQIQRGIEQFQVKSDRGGVIVYKVKWNGEKYQVGENAWSGQPLMEIPNLGTMQALLYVPEVDIGKVKPGQQSILTVDALPGKSYTGKVKSIATLVRAKSYDIPNKVVDVEVELDHIDVAVMRPGMSIRAEIQTSTLADVIAIPVKAVRLGAEGSWVLLRTGDSWRKQSVALGESNGTLVAVTAGLKSGDRISSDPAGVP